MGDIDKAMPESMFERRSGVGFAHSTDETVEGNETRGGKGRTRRPLAWDGPRPDAEPDYLDYLAATTCAGERGGAKRCPDAVHRTAAPHRSSGARESVRSTATTRSGGSRRDHRASGRAEPGSEPSGPAPTPPHGTLPAPSGSTCS